MPSVLQNMFYLCHATAAKMNNVISDKIVFASSKETTSFCRGILLWGIQYCFLEGAKTLNKYVCMYVCMYIVQQSVAQTFYL